MDLTLHQAHHLSKIIDVLGTPESADDLQLCVETCEAAAELYRKHLFVVVENNRRHG
jgi:hypothetical protein